MSGMFAAKVEDRVATSLGQAREAVSKAALAYDKALTELEGASSRGPDAIEAAHARLREASAQMARAQADVAALSSPQGSTRGGTFEALLRSGSISFDLSGEVMSSIVAYQAATSATLSAPSVYTPCNARTGSEPIALSDSVVGGVLMSGERTDRGGHGGFDGPQFVSYQQVMIYADEHRLALEKAMVAVERIEALSPYFSIVGFDLAPYDDAGHEEYGRGSMVTLTFDTGGALTRKDCEQIAAAMQAEARRVR